MSHSKAAASPGLRPSIRKRATRRRAGATALSPRRAPTLSFAAFHTPPTDCVELLSELALDLFRTRPAALRRDDRPKSPVESEALPGSACPTGFDPSQSPPQSRCFVVHDRPPFADDASTGCLRRRDRTGRKVTYTWNVDAA